MTGFYKDYQDPSGQYKSTAEDAADTATSQATIATQQVTIATQQANIATQQANIATQQVNTATEALEDLTELSVTTGEAGTDAVYNSTTNTLQIPRGLPANSATPELLRESLKQVDGAGSELDADKLDGKDSTDFLQTTSTVLGGFF